MDFSKIPIGELASLPEFQGFDYMIAEENPELAQKRADEIIRNTYRTLLTRGMKGCYIYCVDEALGKYLRQRLEAYAERMKQMKQGMNYETDNN